MTRARRGTTFLRRYELLALVGGGDAVVVYQAEDTLNVRPVTVTMQDPGQVDSAGAAARIRHEAEVLAILAHPGVPRVYEFGDAPLGDGSTIAYAVTEPSTGEPLAHHLAGGPLPWPEAVQVAAVVADVLAFAHERGIVHGGLTPAHVLLAADGPVVVGFGTAGSATSTAADDVYALGALLHQMATGEAPHPARSRGSSADPAPAGPPVPSAADVPRAVADISRRCLRRRATERPRAAQVALDLRALVMPISVPMTLQTVPGWLMDEPPAIEDRVTVEERASAEAAAEATAQARGALARAALDRRPRSAAARRAAARLADPLAGPRPTAPRPSDPRPSDPRPSDPGPSDSRPSGPIAGRQASDPIAGANALPDADRPHPRATPHDRADRLIPGHSGHGGRHRRRRPAWHSPTANQPTLA